MFKICEHLELMYFCKLGLPKDSGFFVGFRSVILRNQYSEELEMSSLLVYTEMHRQGIDGEALNPHHALQSGRSLMGWFHFVQAEALPCCRCFGSISM